MLMAAMKTSLIQRIHKTQASDVVHSSGYAKIQREHGGGPHSGMSYSARTQVDQNRTVVKGYSSSMIMQQGNKMPKAASVGEQGSEPDMPVPAYAPQKTQENHFGWKSSSDTIASWGYKRDTTIAANTSLNDTADGTTWVQDYHHEGLDRGQVISQESLLHVSPACRADFSGVFPTLPDYTGVLIRVVFEYVKCSLRSGLFITHCPFPPFHLRASHGCSPTVQESRSRVQPPALRSWHR